MECKKNRNSRNPFINQVNSDASAKTTTDGGGIGRNPFINQVNSDGNIYVAYNPDWKNSRNPFINQVNSDSDGTQKTYGFFFWASQSLHKSGQFGHWQKTLLLHLQR